MKKTFFLLILIAFNIYSITTELKQERKTEIEKKETRNYSFLISGGITFNSGNTKSKLLNGGSKFNIKLKKSEYLTTFETFYGTSKGEQIGNKGKWDNNLSTKIGTNLNLYGVFSLEYDKFSNIDLRTSSGIGIQFVISDIEKNRSKFAASFNSEFLNASNNIENKKSIRLNLNYYSEILLSKTTKFSASVLLTSNLSNITDDYRLESLASISVLMTKPIWLKIKVWNKYNNKPISEKIKKNDFALVTSVEFSI